MVYCQSTLCNVFCNGFDYSTIKVSAINYDILSTIQCKRFEIKNTESVNKDEIHKWKWQRF